MPSAGSTRSGRNGHRLRRRLPNAYFRTVPEPVEGPVIVPFAKVVHVIVPHRA
jgi:hypothetical protein